MYSSTRIHHDAELDTSLFGDLHHLVDRESWCEMNVEVHERQINIASHSEAPGKRQRGHDAPCDRCVFEKTSTFHLAAPTVDCVRNYISLSRSNLPGRRSGRAQACIPWCTFPPMQRFWSKHLPGRYGRVARP